MRDPVTTPATFRIRPTLVIGRPGPHRVDEDGAETNQGEVMANDLMTAERRAELEAEITEFMSRYNKAFTSGTRNDLQELVHLPVIYVSETEAQVRDRYPSTRKRCEPHPTSITRRQRLGSFTSRRHERTSSSRAPGIGPTNR